MAVAQFIFKIVAWYKHKHHHHYHDEAIYYDNDHKHGWDEQILHDDYAQHDFVKNHHDDFEDIHSAHDLAYAGHHHKTTVDKKYLD